MNCPDCGYGPLPWGVQDCPNCQAELPKPTAPTTELTVTQEVAHVEDGGRVTGIEIGKIVGNVAIGLRDYAAVRDRRDKELLLHRVKSAWIEDVLAKIEAVHATFVKDAGLIKLHKRLQPDAVEGGESAAGEVSHLDVEGNRITPDAPLVDIFDALGESLLILGEPGSGKTVTLLQLARATIRRAERNPAEPIPVVLNLSSWVERRSSIAAWVVYELNTPRYGVPRETGRRWLENNDLLLLLDGLDEVGRRHRGDCIDAINGFVTEHGLTGIAVCCRCEEYMSAESRLTLRGAIRLEALTDDQIEAYLQAAGPSLAGLAQALREDADLRELVETPLMLGIMSLTYEDMPASALTIDRADSIRALRRQLFDAYVERMFRYKGTKDKPYADSQTIEWLSWLARRMDEHHKTTFLMEEMQPSWLPTVVWQRTYVIVSRVLVGLVLGSIGEVILAVGTAAYSDVNLNLWAWWLVGLIGGLVAGLATGFVDLAWLWWTGRNGPIGRGSEFWQSATKFLVVGVAVWLSVSLVFGIGVRAGGWLARGWEGWRVDPLSTGLVWGLACGLLFGFGPKGVRRALANDIQTVEQLRWSGGAGLQGGLQGMLFGLAAGAIAGVVSQRTALVSPFVSRGVSTIGIVLIMMGIGMLFCGLVGVVFGGLSGTLMKTRKVRPNQGLHLSLVNACVTAPLLGLGFGLIGCLIGWFVCAERCALAYGIFGLLIGLLATLWYGGVFIFQHTTLRFMLWLQGYTPPLGKLAEFLDYASRRIFLQKVGGGYIFVHRYLQEHFAAMA